MIHDNPQLKIRMPPALKDQVQAAAARNNRTMNAEIISRLERSLAADAVERALELGAPVSASLLNVLAEEASRFSRQIGEIAKRAQVRNDDAQPAPQRERRPRSKPNP